MDFTYLDNNATTQPAPQVVAAMNEYLTTWWGNPSSVHRFGQRARQAIDAARAEVADLVGAGAAELVFTAGGTESINTAVRGLLATRVPRKKIVTTTVEHSATRELCSRLAKEGVEIIQISVDRGGALDWAAFEAAITDDVALATMMHANNETGVVFDVAKASEICREKNVPFHCDATQAVGKLAVDFHAAGFTMASVAAHKFHGPKGVGCLYVRKGVRLKPLIVGGPQERDRHGGTENVAGIAGMGVAATLAKQSLAEMPRVAAMRDRLESSILKSISDTHVNGDPAHRLPNTTNIGFKRLEAEAILISLSEQGVCASAGAACSSGSLEPSHVLRAMGIDEKIAHGAIRFSLSRFTTDVDIDRALQVLPGIITRLRAVLPVATK